MGCTVGGAFPSAPWFCCGIGCSNTLRRFDGNLRVFEFLPCVSHCGALTRVPPCRDVAAPMLSLLVPRLVASVAAHGAPSIMYRVGRRSWPCRCRGKIPAVAPPCVPARVSALWPQVIITPGVAVILFSMQRGGRGTVAACRGHREYGTSCFGFKVFEHNG
jgi:hypothetical protein